MSGYQGGCRCADCRAVSAANKRRQRSVRRGEPEDGYLCPWCLEKLAVVGGWQHEQMHVRERVS